jgi:phosphoglycerate dehydrogenase-like enzyme
MSRALVALTFELDEPGRTAVAAELGNGVEMVSLAGLNDHARHATLGRATVLLSRNTGTELRPGEAGLIRHLRLVQFLTAGVGFIPLRDLPPEVPVASNGGAHAEPMAEHALAMALAAAKRLFIEHAALARGAFSQFTPNRMLAGGICGILGFGGIGIATARLMRGLGMRIHAIRRSGTTEESVDWIGAPD